MNKDQMISRYTELAQRKTEIALLADGNCKPEHERVILEEMSALETAIKFPVKEERAIPEMVTIRQAASRTGLSYDYIRKLCLQQKIVYIRVGTKYLINMERLISFLNNGGTNAT